MSRCPTCDSAHPNVHPPIVELEHEVITKLCPDPFHDEQLQQWRKNDPTDPEFHREGIQEQFMEGLESWLKMIRDGCPKDTQQWYLIDGMLDDVRMGIATGEFPWEISHYE